MSKGDKEREGGATVRSSLSSVAVERTDALELPGTNSSSGTALFLATPIFQEELFITPRAKYNKELMGSGQESHVLTRRPGANLNTRLGFELGF